MLLRIPDHPEAKEQVRLFMFLQALALYCITVMAIFICGFECKVVRCFSSSKSWWVGFFCVLSLILKEPSPLPVYSWALVLEPLCCKVDWISVNALGANSSCHSNLL